MATQVKGVRYTDGVGSSLIKRDVFKSIYNFKPFQTPITQFYWGSKGAKQKTGNPKFEIQEDVLVLHRFSPTAAYTSAGTTATITVAAAGVLNVIVGSTLHNTTTDQNYLVTAVGATTIDVTLLSSGTISNIATTDTFQILGPGFAEGSAAAQAISTQSTFPFNYTQILKESVNMSGTQMATDNYGGSDWVNQRIKATEQFKLKIELNSMFGVRNLIGSGSTLTRFSGGLLDQTSGAIGITDRDQFTGTAFASETYFFDTYLKSLFGKGSNEKTLYCGSDAITGIMNFQKVKQQTKVSEREYGVDIEYIRTNFGRARIVWYPLLEADQSNWVVGVDRDDYLRYMYLSANNVNRDMQYQEKLQSPGDDARLDQYLAEIGTRLAGGTQGVHRVLYGGG